MPRIYVSLTIEEGERLLALSIRERRHPSQQAAHLIVEGLRTRMGPPIPKFTNILPSTDTHNPYSISIEETG